MEGEEVGMSGRGEVKVSGKKKMGRPRKYNPPDPNSVFRQVALSPLPISSSIPLHNSNNNNTTNFPKHTLFQFPSPSPGDQIKNSFGANFTPHVITVNAGEDVNMKVMSFSQQESRAICILSANGTVSNVTLRQPDFSGGTLTYEGRFEILSLTGSFMQADTGGTKGRSGGMSVSLAGPDGRVYGGGLAGLLIAAAPVQVVIGSFLPGHHQEQNPKRSRFEHNTTIYSPSPLNHHSESEVIGGSYGGNRNVIPNSANVTNNLSSENVIQFGRSDNNDDNGSPKFDLSC